MKKYLWMTLCLIVGTAVVFALTGCASTPEMVETSDQMVTDVEAMEETPPVEVEEIHPIQPKEMEDVRFEFDRFDLSPAARATLADNAAWLENNPGTMVKIEGHCDERGTNEYNIALGDRRAKSAYNYLINLGVSSRRLSTISYGEEQPLCHYGTEGCWEKNRRAHFGVK